MTDRVVAWLAGRSGRERSLLAVAAASAVVLALTLAVLAVHDDLAALRRQVAAHERELAGVRVLARRLAAGRPARAASDDAPLLADVQEATDRVVGRGRIASLTPASGPAADGFAEERVALRLSDAALAEVVGLLHALETAAHVVRLDLRKHPDDPARFEATVEVARLRAAS